MYLLRLSYSLRPCSTANTMVAKLSSDRIIRPAFFATSVPLPMATPISAALIAGASLTPSPVIATTSPFFFKVSASSTLCSGATRPTTPMRSIRSSRSASDNAAKSAPRMASPGMPSSLAIAAPVTTSSPVTMRTRMCAACASLTAALDSSRGGSTIPTRLVISKFSTKASRSPSGSKLAASRSRKAAAITRRPASPIRWTF